MISAKGVEGGGGGGLRSVGGRQMDVRTEGEIFYNQTHNRD